MSNLAFDTHKFVTDLSKAGMDTSVAEVLANHYASLLNDRIATKDDLNALRTELKGEMAALRGEMAELKGEMAELKGEMTVLEERLTARLVSAQLTVVLAICAILGSLMVFLQL